MNYLMDPYLYGIPADLTDSDALCEYLGTLSCWTTPVISGEHKFWVSGPATMVLWEMDKFPTYSLLRNLLEQATVEEFDVIIAARACEGVLGSPPYLDDEILRLIPEINQVIVDEKKTIVIPDEIAQRLDPQVADGLRETLAKLAYAQQYHAIELAVKILFATEHIKVEKNGNVNAQGSCYRATEDAFYPIDGWWKTIYDPSEVDWVGDLMDFWQDTRRAVRWAYQDLLNRQELDPIRHKLPEDDQWKVGYKFNTSIAENNFDRPEVLPEIFHALVKVLTNYWPKKVDHDHNKHLKRGSKKVKRSMDNALAWRAHVTNRPGQIRLHYWLIEGQKVEFANIGFWNDFKIEQ